MTQGRMTQEYVDAGRRVQPRGLDPAQPVLSDAGDTPRGVRTRLIVGVAWTIVVSVLGQGSAFLCMLISARLLGREDYGKLAMLLSLVGTLANFAGVGLGLTVIKFLSELRCHAPDRAGRILGLCSVVTATSTNRSSGVCCASCKGMAYEPV